MCGCVVSGGSGTYRGMGMSKQRLQSLLLGEYTYFDDYVGTLVSVETAGAYAEVRSALDRGEPLGIVDVVDAELLLGLLDDDEAAKAAAALALCGWKPEQLGGLFHPKLGRGRPGRRLLGDAALMMVARKRQVDAEAAKHREGLRA